MLIKVLCCLLVVQPVHYQKRCYTWLSLPLSLSGCKFLAGCWKLALTIDIIGVGTPSTCCPKLWVELALQRRRRNGMTCLYLCAKLLTTKASARLSSFHYPTPCIPVPGATAELLSTQQKPISGRQWASWHQPWSTPCFLHCPQWQGPKQAWCWAAPNNSY